MRSQRFSTLSVLLVTLLVALLAVTPALAEREDDTNRKSKNGLTEGTIGGVEVQIEYGRPKVKERAIWGGLVPWGQVWRTGADEATKVTFSGDVTIEGQALAAGSYSLFTIPGQSEWTVIFNTVADQWGAYEYAEGKDALRVKVASTAHEHTEEMAFVIDGDNLVLRWERLALPIAVAAGN